MHAEKHYEGIHLDLDTKREKHYISPYTLCAEKHYISPYTLCAEKHAVAHIYTQPHLAAG